MNNHNRKITLTMVIVGTAIIGAFLFYKPHKPGPASSVKAASQIADPTINSNENNNNAITPAKLKLTYDGVTSANQMSFIQGKSYGHALYINSQLNSICDTRGSGKKSPPPAQFCDQYHMSKSTLENEAQSLPATDPYAKVYFLASELYSSVSSVESSEKLRPLVDDMTKLMLSENREFESIAAAEAFQQTGIVSLPVAQYAASNSIKMSRSELLAAQTLASKMDACSRLGGCGPNEALSIIFCASESNCSPSEPAHNTWVNNYSPLVYNAAEKIKYNVFR